MTTLVLVLALGAVTALAQAGSGTILGRVTDPAGAVVPNASVTITDKNTNDVIKATTNGAGEFIVPSVKPGKYEIRITEQGFQTAVIKDQVLEIGKQLTENVALKVGAVTEEITVRAEAVQLQTLDASVGNVLDEQALQKLPSLSHDATALLLIQPLAAPGFNGAAGSGEGNNTGGGIAGARADQNTFMVDGGDATSNTEGAAGYAQQAASGFAATPKAAIPTPVESLQEMRVITNNSNTFARSSGGEVQMVTRSGTNAWHGAAYENNQNTDYNANTWQLNRAKNPLSPTGFGKPRGIWIDNRFGGRLGGPILKDKAFFFLMYEGHDFKKANPITRTVPSALMRQGILQFKDASGVLRQYNLNPGAGNVGCGAAGALNCDPRGKGLDPVIASIWALEPPANNPNEGDKLNTQGFDSSVPVIVRDNFGVAKFDYKLNDRWDLNTSYHYAVSDGVGSGQSDIGGLIKGHTLGSPVATRTLPTQPRYFTFGGTGHIGSNLTTEAHFNLLRHWWQWKPVSPFPQVAGTAAAVQIAAESAGSGLVPMNIDTQNARSRNWNGKDFAWGDNTTWLKGKHIFSFGGEFRHEHFTHTRDDKVVGALTTPVYFADRDPSALGFGTTGNFQPPTCTTAVTTNCIKKSDISRWQTDYISVLGMVSHASQLLTRGADFSPNAAGTPLHQNTIVDWYNLYFADTWRVTPTFSATLGLGWGAQTPPYEQSGEQAIMVNSTTGKPIVYTDFLNSLAAAAAGGQSFAPTLGFAPIKSQGRKYPYDPEWNDFEPRVSFAWNPSSFLQNILGDRKTVIRAGYGRYHDRLNGVGLVMTPALGIGFGNTVICNGPQMAGGGCVGSNPSNAFRIGTDGSSVPLPTLAPVKGALVPGNDDPAPPAGANSPYEALDFRIDPHRKVGVEDTWDLSIQRQLPGNTLIEVGYVGRMAHHLYTVNDMNQVPYMFKLRGQTFADAYDKVAAQVRAGQPVTAQPFFENIPGATAVFAAAEEKKGGFFTDGLVTNIFDDAIGLPYFDNQVNTFQTTTSNGNSNYHAGYVSIRKQFSRGLLFQANYTWSHSLDTVGFTQENVFISPSDNFNPHRDYGASGFDRRHTLNLFYVYDLPFGKGHFLGSSNNILDRIIGGWTFSGQFQAASGIPLTVTNATASGEEYGNGDSAGLGSGISSGMIPLAGAPTSSSTHYNSDGSVTAFPNPDPTLFRKLFFADQRTGTGAIRSFPRWNMDAALSKKIKITERVNMGFGLQAVNAFNHMEFQDPNLDIGSGIFGVTSLQYTSPRFLNLNVRVDF